MKTLKNLKIKIETLEELLNKKALLKTKTSNDFKKIREKLNLYLATYGE